MRTRIVALTAGGICWTAASGVWADVTAFDLVKARYYVQDSAAPPSAPTVYALESYVDVQAGGEVGQATLDGVPYDQTDTVAWDFVRDFGSKAALDAAFPSGATYTIQVSGGSLGTLSEDVSLPSPEAYPAAPVFSAQTMAAIDGADPAVSILVEWSAPDPGTNIVILSLYDVGADDFVLETDFVAGDSLLIDASLLNPGTEYELSVIFGNVEMQSGSAGSGFGPNAESFQGYLSGTFASFTTGDGTTLPDLDAGMLKFAEHRQTGNDAPPGPAESWGFEAFFDAGPDGMAFGNVSGGAATVGMTEFEPGRWEIPQADALFPSKAALDSAFPSGQQYTMDIGGGTLGVRSQDFDLGPDAYPTPPSLVGGSFDALQGMDPDLDLTLFWAAPGAGVDLIGYAIERPGTGEIVTEGLLLPDVTELILPVGLLEPGEDYEVLLTFGDVTVRSGSGVPGFDATATLVEGYLSDTWIGFTTGGGCGADLAAPFGVLNFFDLAAYIGLFNAGDPAADLAAPFGSLNFFDVAAYIASYNAGCP